MFFSIFWQKTNSPPSRLAPLARYQPHSSYFLNLKVRSSRISEWQPLFLREWEWPHVEIKISEDNPPNGICIWNRKGTYWVENMGLLKPVAHQLERRIVSWPRTDTMRSGLAEVLSKMLQSHHCCWCLNPSQTWFLRLISQGKDSWADTPNWPSCLLHSSPWASPDHRFKAD